MAWPRGVKKGSRHGTLKDAMAQNESGESDVSRETKPEQVVEQAIMPRPREIYKAAKPAAAKPKWTMYAGNNWDGATVSEDTPRFPLDIPLDMRPEGMALQWGTRSIHGQEQKQMLNDLRQAGWTEVHESDFDGLGAKYARMFSTDDSGYIVKEACILMARPDFLHKKAVERDERQAKEQLALKAQAFTGGQIAVTGADHPSAVGSNRISRTMERLEIPGDE